MELGLRGRSALITGAGDGIAPAGGYRLLQSADVRFRPLLEGAPGVDFNDPAVLARFREAQIDLLTRPVFTRS